MSITPRPRRRDSSGIPMTGTQLHISDTSSESSLYSPIQNIKILIDSKHNPSSTTNDLSHTSGTTIKDDDIVTIAKNPNIYQFNSSYYNILRHKQSEFANATVIVLAHENKYGTCLPPILNDLIQNTTVKTIIMFACYAPMILNSLTPCVGKDVDLIAIGRADTRSSIDTALHMTEQLYNLAICSPNSFDLIQMALQFSVGNTHLKYESNEIQTSKTHLEYREQQIFRVKTETLTPYPSVFNTVTSYPVPSKNIDNEFLIPFLVQQIMRLEFSPEGKTQSLRGIDLLRQCNQGEFPNTNPLAHELLRQASEFNYLEIVEKLIQAGADVNKAESGGFTPLAVAAYQNYLEIAEKLIQAGADTNKAGSRGVTPLATAAYQNHLEIAEKLIQAGADIDKADSRGVTPLANAAARNSLEIAKKLIEAGADINKADLRGFTPLAKAAARNHGEIIKLLLNYTSIEIDNRLGMMEKNNILVVAARQQNVPVIRKLLDMGANINTSTPDGTPLESLIKFVVESPGYDVFLSRLKSFTRIVLGQRINRAALKDVIIASFIERSTNFLPINDLKKIVSLLMTHQHFIVDNNKKQQLRQVLQCKINIFKTLACCDGGYQDFLNTLDSASMDSPIPYDSQLQDQLIESFFIGNQATLSPDQMKGLARYVRNNEHTPLLNARIDHIDRLLTQNTHEGLGGSPSSPFLMPTFYAPWQSPQGQYLLPSPSKSITGMVWSPSTSSPSTSLAGMLLSPSRQSARQLFPSSPKSSVFCPQDWLH